MSLLEINNLHIDFNTKKGINHIINGVDLSLDKGEVLSIVGESGCGKSVTAMSILGLLDSNAKITDGSIKFNEFNLLDLSTKELQKIRGNDISMIFQEPMTSLNPVVKIKTQLMEVLKVHGLKDKHQQYDQALSMLNKVKIKNPELIMEEYPHNLSGGMRQRVMIAMALMLKPSILIADEPTTALDVTIQASILELMKELKDENNTSIIFITHDLGIVNDFSDKVAIMYCGEVVEYINSKLLFSNPTDIHPYTKGLLNSVPTLNTDSSVPLKSIDGIVPTPNNLPKGCKFSDRCKYCTEKCKSEEPELNKISENHYIKCFYPKLAGESNE